MPSSSDTTEAEATPTRSLQHAYDLYSLFYGWLAPCQHHVRLHALERAALRADDRVLEVAPGPGNLLVDIARNVAPTKPVFAIDLSPKMIEAARRRLRRAHVINVRLLVGDARRLPFCGETFDVVYNCGMMNVLSLSDVRLVLNEFHRVLKPQGRLALVTMTKRNQGRRTLLECFYECLPARLKAYTGRPLFAEQLVIESSFCAVERECANSFWPLEIILGRKQ